MLFIRLIVTIATQFILVRLKNRQKLGLMNTNQRLGTSIPSPKFINI